MAATASARIAQVIAKCLDLNSAPCTVSELAKAGGAAPSTIQMWCATIGIRARDVVLFTRGLWAIHRAESLDAAPNDLLGFAEMRSLRAYLQRTGPLSTSAGVVSAETYCARQSLLLHRYILSEVLRLVSARTALAILPYALTAVLT